jgi:hypothetical protein
MVQEAEHLPNMHKAQGSILRGRERRREGGRKGQREGGKGEREREGMNMNEN